MLKRAITSRIKNKLYKNKIIVIYGARQVGKTTLIKMLAKEKGEHLYLNCDEPDVRELLTNSTSTRLKDLTSNYNLVLIDEAQRVKNIGLTLKLFADELSDKQIIVTGSSSLEVSNDISEPLTGRKYEFILFPFSVKELLDVSNSLEFTRLLEERLIYGMYPEIVLKPDERKDLLKSLTADYLFKDVLNYQDIRKPEILEKLLTLLAAQIGSEVSYNELANTLRIDNATVIKYIELLEKSFVIFKLNPFSRNVRTELTKMRKIYFYDNGIRNALLRNFNSLSLRQDSGALWENFLISERIKKNTYENKDYKNYFWRTTQQQEIDYIEESADELSAYEFKYNNIKKVKIPITFKNAYPNANDYIINKDNFIDFLTN